MKDIQSGADGDARHAPHEQLSALMDGELDAGAAGQCCALWRDQIEARSNWHVYHLIGDVLRARSEEVACDVARDARLLQALRRRLAEEPAPAAAPVRVPPAPRVPPAARFRGRLPRGEARPTWRGGWRMAMAASAGAGVTALVALLVVMQGPSVPLSGSGGTLAKAPPQAVPVTVAMPPVPAPAGDTQVAGPVAEQTAIDRQAPSQPVELADMRVIRDVRLDRYLAAHSQFDGSSALGMPSGFLRSSTRQASAR